MTFDTLLTAVTNGNVQALNEFAVENPTEIAGLIGIENFKLFEVAAERGYFEVMEKLIELAPSDMKAAMISTHGFGVFQAASEGRRLPLMLKLIEFAQAAEREALIRANNFFAFRLAATEGQLMATEMLLTLTNPKLRAEMISAKGFEAFRLAARDGYVEVIEKMIALAPSHTNAEMISADDFAVFKKAALAGHFKVIEMMITLSPAQVVNEMIRTSNFFAFRAAAQRGHFDVMEKLIELVAPETRLAMLSAQGMHAFELAAHGGHHLVVEKLIELTQPEIREEMLRANDFYAFHVAANNGHYLVVEKLIELTQPEVREEMLRANDFYAFRFAAQKGHHLVVEKLIERAPPELREEMIRAKGFYAFRFAAQEGHQLVIQKLIALSSKDLLEEMIRVNNFGVFQLAVQKGHFEIMETLIEQASPETKEAMLRARGFHAFERALECRRQDIVERLLSCPVVFAYAEMRSDAYSEVIQSFINAHLTELRQQKEANPAAVFDISNPDQASLYFYMMRNCIRQGSIESMQQMAFLLSIPSVRALAHQEITPNESNELLCLALLLNHHEAAAMLFQIPEVRDLAARSDFGLDLRVLAGRRESSMKALSRGQQKALEKVEEKYQAEINGRGIKDIMDDLRRCLEKRYHDNPATVEADGERILILPFRAEEFRAFADTLPADIQKLSLESYYQHPDHTAYRYVLRRNPWMSAEAEQVHVDAEGAWSFFEDSESLIALLYLAVKDESAEAVDGWTIDGRIANFIKELAFIGRAHNWDETRLNSDTGIREEYDDLEGDKPSCIPGVKRRLFQSVLGHPLLSPLTKDIVSQAVCSVMREHFIRRINDDNYAGLFKVWNTLIEGFPVDAGILQELNLSEEEKLQHIATIFKRLNELYEGQFDPSLYTHLHSLFEITSPYHSLAEKFGGRTDLFTLLIDKQKEILNPIILDVIRGYVEVSINDGNCVELQRAWMEGDEGVLNQLNFSEEVKKSQMELILERFREKTGLSMHEDLKAYLDTCLSANLAQNYGQYIDLTAILLRKVAEKTNPAPSAESSTVRRFFETLAENTDSTAYEAPKGLKRLMSQT